MAMRYFRGCKRSQMAIPQSHKLEKHTQTIRRQQSTNCLSVFEHLVGLVFKGLNA